MNQLWTCGRTCLRYKVIEMQWREMGWLLDYCDSNWAALDFHKSAIPLGQIVATQAELSVRILNRYVRKTRLVDAANHLPYGVRLAGDPTVYMIDGHHRWAAAQIKGRRVLRMMIVNFGLQPTDPEYEKETVF